MNFNLSVIVPIYGVEKYIERCAISLFEQTLDNIEFIFVNDMTKDNSIELLDGVIDKYPHLKHRIKIINHTKNLGQAAARNTGIKHANGNYIIYLDGDDWVDIKLYEAMYKIAKKENADIACCGFKFMYHEYNVEVNFTAEKEEFLDLKKLNFDLLYSSLCNKMVRKEIYSNNKLNFFNGVNMWEDVGMMTRLRFFSKKVVFLEDDLFYFYNKMNENSIVSVPKEDNILQQIKCANLLEEFFKTKNGNFSLVVSFLKFMAKSDYLYNDKIRNINKWKVINMESNKNIFKYYKLPLNMRILAWLASKNIIFVVKILLFFKSKISGISK